MYTMKNSKIECLNVFGIGEKKNLYSKPINCTDHLTDKYKYDT